LRLCPSASCFLDPSFPRPQLSPAALSPLANLLALAAETNCENPTRLEKAPNAADRLLAPEPVAAAFRQPRQVALFSHRATLVCVFTIRREANYQMACEEVQAHLEYGTPLSELLQQVGLDSSVLDAVSSNDAAPPPPPPPPPPPAAEPFFASAAPIPPPPPPAEEEPVVFAAAVPPLPSTKTVADVEAPQELRDVAAYILWEHAGMPDGADFAAEALVRVFVVPPSATPFHRVDHILAHPPGRH
jgi:hypothetical protein